MENTDISKQLFDYIKTLDLSKPGAKPALLKRIKKTVTKAKKTATKQNKEKAKKTLSPLQKAYRKYFSDMLAIYGVDNPAQIKPENKKKAFFNNIKKYWINGEGAKENWKEKVKLNESNYRKIKYKEVILENKELIEKRIIKEKKIRKYIRTQLKKKLNEEYKLKLIDSSDTKEFDGFLQDNNIEAGMSKKGTFLFGNEKDYIFATKLADDYGFDYTN